MNEDHISHQTDKASTIEVGEDHQRAVHTERCRYDVTNRRYRYDNYANRSDSSNNNQLTASQRMEAKLFLDKIAYFNGSNNKEALNYLAQCEEAAAKMKTPEIMVAWSKLAGRADVVMREESRQHEGIVTWEVFQSIFIEHFCHIPSKGRAAKLLNKLQQDPHESTGDYVQRGSEIIQFHSGKTNLRDISVSQYGWNIVQGLINIPIKNKLADCILHCQSLSDVCKLIRQVIREMENREAFTGISAEPEESVEEVNWKQNNYNPAIQITEGSPVFVKQYTILLKYQNYIDDETKRLEEAGLISRSLSNWSAPCMVVPKKQDTDKPNKVQLRMVIDYRQLNKWILTSRAPDRNGKVGKVISNYPIPTIESLLARLEGCKYFSILDLRSGYHRIGLSEKSKPLTAFTMHSGKFQ